MPWPRAPLRQSRTAVRFRSPGRLTARPAGQGWRPWLCPSRQPCRLLGRSSASTRAWAPASCPWPGLGCRRCRGSSAWARRCVLSPPAAGRPVASGGSSSAASGPGRSPASCGVPPRGGRGAASSQAPRTLGSGGAEGMPCGPRRVGSRGSGPRGRTSWGGPGRRRGRNCCRGSRWRPRRMVPMNASAPCCPRSPSWQESPGPRSSCAVLTAGRCSAV
mmetsp:Transcript_34150/g.106017  ORF Transcript_34150/g.106017 Transcript_34150/m.106017 type:complete len:218 (+) Transcript_34150:366-1019(+)